MSFGVNQVLLAAVLGSMIFAVFTAHLLRISVQLRTLHLGPSASGPFGTLLCCFLNYCGSAPPFPLHKRSLLLDFPFLSSFSCRFATFLLPQFFTSEELALLDAYASLFTTLARSSIHHHPVRHHRLTTTLEAEWAMLLGEDDLVERGKASTNRRSSQDVRRRTSFRSDPGGAKGEGIEMDRPVTDNKERPRSRRRPSRARSVTLNAVPTTPMVASIRNTTFSLVYLMAPASLIDELGCGDCIGRCALRAPVPHFHLVRCGPIPLVW